ncbi:MLO-like protein [Drosera capensis]
MAVTHITYSCLTMLLAIVKIQRRSAWEDEARADRHDALTEITRELVTRRQSSFVKFHASNPLSKKQNLDLGNLFLPAMWTFGCSDKLSYTSS